MTRPVVDIVGYASIDRIEAPDGSAYDSIGGAAIYAALSAARLGVAPRLSIAVGEDFPDAWLARLGSLGIDTAPVERRAGPSRRVRLVYGANEARQDSASRTDQWWERTMTLTPPIPTRADTCLLCPLPPELIPSVRAAVQGVLIADTSEVFAASGASALSLFRNVDLFAPSLDEAELLTGERDETRILTRLSQVAPRVILKRGARGLLHWQDGGVRVRAPIPRKAIDPTGAGDATIGAIAAAIALGCSIEDQLVAGTAAGALTVGMPGPEALGWSAGERP